jgi:cation diffusion facilitator CzcD-associated flavoprotein CzcO
MPGLPPPGVIPPDVAVQSCDVCIVGAGLAGLNALFVASRYLSRDQKVILVDRRERVGGMWVDTYPYVRLHQPHPMFTAGNIEWTLGRDRSYLATKGEVLDHLEHCLNVIKQRVQVDELFGWAMESSEEVDGKVRITARTSAGRLLVVEAKRLIKAYGFGVVPKRPTRDLQRACRVGVSRLLRHATGRDAGERHPGVDHWWR